MVFICISPNALLPSLSKEPTAPTWPLLSFHPIAFNKIGSVPYILAASSQQTAYVVDVTQAPNTIAESFIIELCIL
ncbi:Uncharacterised protein [Acinetobacter baumannii]|nr:Uncharacterised protein [Acinetobacter baumannii]